MSDKVKDFMRKGLVDEFHLAEIITLCVAHNLSPWLITSQAWEELAQKAVNDRAKKEKKAEMSKSLTFTFKGGLKLKSRGRLDILSEARYTTLLLSPKKE